MFCTKTSRSPGWAASPIRTQAKPGAPLTSTPSQVTPGERMRSTSRVLLPLSCVLGAIPLASTTSGLSIVTSSV